MVTTPHPASNKTNKHFTSKPSYMRRLCCHSQVFSYRPIGKLLTLVIITNVCRRNPTKHAQVRFSGAFYFWLVRQSTRCCRKN